MRRALPLVLLVLLGAGCSTLGGKPEDTVTVAAEGSGPDETSSIAAVRRRAVEGLFDLYLSSAQRAAESESLAKVLEKSGDFVARERELSRERLPGEVRRKSEVSVKIAVLGRALDAQGLVKPTGVRGEPRLVLALRESAPAAPHSAGRASEALRRGLIERGYNVMDVNDLGLERKGQEAPREAVLAYARRVRADFALIGAAQTQALPDAQLGGLKQFQARVALSLVPVAGGEASPGSVDQQAEAVDLEGEAAAAKSLEDAGLLAADKAKSLLSGRYVERAELGLIVDNLGTLDQTRHLLEVLRAQPGVVGAALDAVVGRDVKLRVFVERMGPDELAALALKLPGYALSIRSVESDYALVEVEEAGEAP